MVPKAQSVTATGEPDGFTPPRAFRADVFPDGHTRLVVSVPPEELRATHLALVGALSGRLGLRYVQLTDRKVGQLPAPVGRVAMELDAERVRAGLEARARLVWEDGRHQLWLRGALGETVILDELGLLHCSPDDPSFRDALAALGIPEGTPEMMDKRDYVRVAFLSEADAEEESLIEDFKLLKWR
jgi:hypothetical protein